MAQQKKKVTRIMKVTLDEDEFEKYDSGITHSDNGLRNEQGQLSALPDIAPLSESDLPYREIVKRETVYVEREKEHARSSTGSIIGDAVIEVLDGIFSDPEIQEQLAELGRVFWRYKVKPRITDAIHWLKSDKKFEIKAKQLVAVPAPKEEIAYQLEVTNAEKEKYIVSGEEAAELVRKMQDKARELSAMIYLLSHICVKDDKTDAEYMLEQTYIQQLVSNEAKTTMQQLMAHKQILDEGTIVCFSDFLNGYLRNGNERIPLPVGNTKTGTN